MVAVLILKSSESLTAATENLFASASFGSNLSISYWIAAVEPAAKLEPGSASPT
jgi:hypothetical protein